MSDAYRKIIGLIESRPWLFAAGIALIVGAALWVASGLKLDGDLGRLLPESARSVQGLRQLEKSYGDQLGRLTVVLSADELQKSREAAIALEKPLSEIEGVDRVVIRAPASELEDLRLLYIDDEDLDEIAKRIKKRIRWEKQRANPLFASLGGKKPSADVSDIEKKYEGQLSDREFYESDDGKVLVFIHPDFPASKLDQTRALVAAVEKSAAATLNSENADVSFALTGRYKKRIVQQELMTDDITSSTPIALLVLAIFLILYFRSFSSAIQVVVPLIVGTIGGMAFARLVFTNLNILTGFLAAILLGLGVDYGIHLVSRFHEVRGKTDSFAKAWDVAFSTSGRANIYSGMTTMLAVGSLAVSSFRAFYEFGIIAMAGIALILVSYAFVLPVLICLMSNVMGRPGEPFSSIIARRLDARLQSFDSETRRTHLGWLRRGAYGFLLVGVVAAIFGLQNLEFDRSFESLQITDTEAHRLDEMVNDVLGQSQTPAVVLAANEEHRRAIVEAVEDRRGAEGGDTIGAILSLGDVIPESQQAKLETLEELVDRIEGVPERARTDELKEFYEEIKAVVEHEEVTRENLPRSVKKPFSRRDDAEASVVLVMPGVSLSDARNNSAFALVLRGLPGPDGTEKIDAISDAQLLADILEFVTSDTTLMVILTLLGLLLVAFVAFRSFDSVRLLFNLGLAFFIALGVVGLTELKFNFINVLIIPIWLGLGVDASFHILVHLRAHAGEFAPQVSTVLSVSAAFLTSMIGFGALIMSHHTGLASLGWAAVLGLGSIMIASGSIAAIMTVSQQLDDEEKA